MDYCAMNHWPGSQGLCGFNLRATPGGLLCRLFVALSLMLFLPVNFCQTLAAQLKNEDY